MQATRQQRFFSWFSFIFQTPPDSSQPQSSVPYNIIRCYLLSRLPIFDHFLPFYSFYLLLKSSKSCLITFNFLIVNIEPMICVCALPRSLLRRKNCQNLDQFLTSLWQYIPWLIKKSSTILRSVWQGLPTNKTALESETYPDTLVASKQRGLDRKSTGPCTVLQDI